MATIGFFDGVHLGHQYLINKVIDAARDYAMQSMVITFDRHPATVVRPEYKPQLLTGIDDKLALLSRTAIDNCVVLPFDYNMSQLTPKEFMQTILKRQLNTEVLIIGYDNHFGKRNSDKPEGFDDYVGYGRQTGIDVMRAAPKSIEGVNVSSSVVRSFLSDGQVEMAAKCLGRQYRITGIVVPGVQKGRQLGFPTANIAPESVATMLPAPGVYHVAVEIDGDGINHNGIMNIGTRPTFGGKDLTIEVHLLDFKDDLYGEKLTVKFISRIREERQFDNELQLKEQLKKDAAQAAQAELAN